MQLYATRQMREQVQELHINPPCFYIHVANRRSKPTTIGRQDKPENF